MHLPGQEKQNSLSLSYFLHLIILMLCLLLLPSHPLNIYHVSQKKWKKKKQIWHTPLHISTMLCASDEQMKTFQKKKINIILCKLSAENVNFIRKWKWCHSAKSAIRILWRFVARTRATDEIELPAIWIFLYNLYTFMLNIECRSFHWYHYHYICDMRYAHSTTTIYMYGIYIQYNTYVISY